MRYSSRGYVSKDQNGRVLQSATVSVFLAGTTTPASIYAAETGGVAVNSIVSDATTGYFQFWVDIADYTITQLFDIYISKAVFANISYEQSFIYNEPVFSGLPLVGSKSWTPTAAMGDGTVQYTTVTVTGAKSGDCVICGFPFLASSAFQNGFLISGSVSADDTVTVIIENKTGGAVTLDAGTLTVGVYHL